MTYDLETALGETIARRIAALNDYLFGELRFVGNDAEEAVTSASKLDESRAPLSQVVTESVVERLRRLVRRSMVLQVLRLRLVAVTDTRTRPRAERPDARPRGRPGR